MDRMSIPEEPHFHHGEKLFEAIQCIVGEFGQRLRAKEFGFCQVESYQSFLLNWLQEEFDLEQSDRLYCFNKGGIMSRRQYEDMVEEFEGYSRKLEDGVLKMFKNSREKKAYKSHPSETLVGHYIRCCEDLETTNPKLSDLHEYSKLSQATLSKQLNNLVFLVNLVTALKKKEHLAKIPAKRTFWFSVGEEVGKRTAAARGKKTPRSMEYNESQPMSRKKWSGTSIIDKEENGLEDEEIRV